MAKKNILKYIILGLLEKQELTGYDIKKIFEDEIGEFWKSNHSQIYPELRKLEEQKLISFRVEIVGSKLEKKYYTLMDDGKAKLNEWIFVPTPELLATKDEFILKLYFIDDKKDGKLEKMFEEQIMLHQEKLEHLKFRMQTIFASQKEKELNYGHYLILNHAINREKGYLLWLTDQYIYIEKNEEL
ncbi:PadR family transcriptional regulator (plasmid) [Clostridium estertheticum]|uniref:PadR family transcriptional regulator n=1 Tax=Clostridium estertheticum TaxID=238834 RepID=UPI001C0AF034|nr:PadR family transcriptional regulator [Clostridium estertheticum]MBU3201782.1 PadR family transcriptional regulator [Clostridium estertheticum]WAG68177.1 PadR family transcriptional regulator [Clostridium estertheticum]